jgi:hypothetical protein
VFGRTGQLCAPLRAFAYSRKTHSHTLSVGTR